MAGDDDGLRLNAAIILRFYHGKDPATLTMGQFNSLIERIRPILNLESGNDAETPDDWFKKTSVSKSSNG